MPKDLQLFPPERVIFLLLIVMLFTSTGVQSDVPKLADVAKIYNIEKASDQKVDVRYYRKGECDDKWCNIHGEGEYLKANDYLQTGEISRADLALMYSGQQYNEVLFWQQEGSRSKFEPKEGTCHFRVDTGGFLYAHPNQSVNPGCEKIFSKNALVIPNGTVLFIESTENDTLVGVLSNHPGGLIKVQHLNSNEVAELKAGESAKALQNGKIVKGVFSLDDFYRKKPLTLGLGSEDKDDEYINQQEPAIQVILKKLREETIAAVDEQKKNIADGHLPDIYTQGGGKVGGTGTAGTTGTSGGVSTSDGTSTTPNIITLDPIVLKSILSTQTPTPQTPPK